MVANLEGYLQETIITLIKDINRYNAFPSTHYAMKKTYCLQFIPEEKGNEKRIARLIEKFDGLKIAYDEEPFIYANKNPKISIIESLYTRICGESFLGYISGNGIEDVFQNDIEANENYSKLLRKRISEGVKEFPYNIDLSGLGINVQSKTIRTECPWSVFINEILKNRHRVAHGVRGDLTVGRDKIKEYKGKIIILELLFTVLLFSKALQPK